MSHRFSVAWENHVVCHPRFQLFKNHMVCHTRSLSLQNRVISTPSKIYQNHKRAVIFQLGNLKSYSLTQNSLAGYFLKSDKLKTTEQKLK